MAVETPMSHTVGLALSPNSSFLLMHIAEGSSDWPTTELLGPGLCLAQHKLSLAFQDN